MKYKLKEHVTDEMLNTFLKNEYHMNYNKEIELIIAVNVGYHSEVLNKLYCDMHGDELDFTLSHHEYSEHFEKQVNEIYQHLIDLNYVEVVE